MRQNEVMERVEQILQEQETISSGQLAKVTGVTRQAAHYHLRQLVELGTLVPVGAGRSAAYRPRDPMLYRVRTPIRGLDEHVIWDEVKVLSDVAALRPNVSSIVNYSLTEILNNAIDHSSSESVLITVSKTSDRLRFAISDEGVGIFEKVRGTKLLKTEIEAIAALQKGKVTSMPSRHTGEGIFFVSKMGDLMTIESHTLRWSIDNARNDKAVESISYRKGTKVHWEIDLESERVRERVHQDYQVGTKFKKTRTSIALFNSGDEFVSRSEAKRLTAGLEDFQEVELDFGQVKGIGQGFADEVFRVWTRDHPGTELRPTNMNDAVRFMVERAKTGWIGEQVPLFEGATDAEVTHTEKTPTASAVFGKSSTSTGP